MQIFLPGVVTTLSHGVGVSIYNLFTLNTRYSMSKWTRLQWGGLASATALSVIRPHIQEKIDKSPLGKKFSNIFFDLTPFLALGLTTWQATKFKQGSLLTGAYFAIVSKICNLMQHSIAYEYVFGDKYCLLPEKRVEPRNYYEKLALKRGNAIRPKNDLTIQTAKELIQGGDKKRAFELIKGFTYQDRALFIPEWITTKIIEPTDDFLQGLSKSDAKNCRHEIAIILLNRKQNQFAKDVLKEPVGK